MDPVGNISDPRWPLIARLQEFGSVVVGGRWWFFVSCVSVSGPGTVANCFPELLNSHMRMMRLHMLEGNEDRRHVV